MIKFLCKDNNNLIIKQVSAHCFNILYSMTDGSHIQSLLINEISTASSILRHITVGKTFLEHEQTTYTAVAVLKRMDRLKTHVEISEKYQKSF